MLARLRMCFETEVTFVWQKYIITAFALLILLAVIALIVGLSVGLTKPPLWELREVKRQNNSRALFAAHTFSLFIYLLTSATFFIVLSEVLRWNVALPRKSFWHLLFILFYFFIPPTETRLPCHVCARRFPAYSHHIRWNLWVMDVTAHDLASFSCSQLLQQWATSSRLHHFCNSIAERLSWLGWSQVGFGLQQR